MGQYRTAGFRAFRLRPLAGVCLAFALSVALSVYLLTGWQMLLLMAGTLFCGLASALRQHPRLAAVFLAMAVAFTMVWLRHYEVTNLEDNWADQTAALTLEARGYPEEVEFGWSLEAVILTEGDLEGQKTILYLDEAREIKPGDLLYGEVHLSSTRGTLEPWIYYSYSKEIYLTASAQRMNVTAQDTPWYLLPCCWAKHMTDTLEALLPGEKAGFLASISLGDRSALPDGLYQDLNRTGLSHIAAASGLHVQMLCFACFLLPGDRRKKSLLLMPCLLIYAAIVGFTPSICRAVFMQELILLAPTLERETDGITSLSLALAVILIQNPIAITDAGLQLSFASMLGILLLLPALDEWSGDWGRWNAVKTSILMSLAANAFSLPLVLYYFGTASVLSSLSNLLLLWMLPILLPLALLTGGTGWALLVPVLEKISGLMIWAVHKLAEFQWAVFTIEHRQFLVWLTLCCFAGIAALLCRWGKWKVVTAIAAGVAALALCFWSVREYYDSGKLTCAMLDVGQGQCLLLTTENRTVVVDCGSQNEDSWAALDGELSLAGREEVDLLILTHFDSDHINGVTELLKNRQVHQLVLPVPTVQELADSRLISMLAKGQGTEVSFLWQTTDFELDSAVFRIFQTHSENEIGLAVLASVGEEDILIMGDADLTAEERLVQEEDLPDVEVLAASHHGSANGTGETLLKKIRPELVLISVGENNYGHPTEEMLKRCQAFGAQVLRTDEEHTIFARIG